MLGQAQVNIAIPKEKKKTIKRGLAQNRAKAQQGARYSPQLHAQHSTTSSLWWKVGSHGLRQLTLKLLLTSYAGCHLSLTSLPSWGLHCSFNLQQLTLSQSAFRALSSAVYCLKSQKEFPQPCSSCILHACKTSILQMMPRLPPCRPRLIKYGQ